MWLVAGNSRGTGNGGIVGFGGRPLQHPIVTFRLPFGIGADYVSVMIRS